LGAYAVLAGFNLVLTVLIQYWGRLYYWCLEGRVPWLLILGSITLIAALWMVGNRMLIRRSELGWRGWLVVPAVVALLYADPLLRPMYMAKLDELAMQQSFKILAFFSKG
jgi:hypothetical protein